jgi:hypothetical protein
MKQSMKQFSKTQRSITTVGYDELRRNSISNKISLISSFTFRGQVQFTPEAVECLHSVQSLEGIGMVREGIDIFGRGKG